MEPALTVFVMGPQLINNGCAVMRNLGKPLRDSERHLHVWQQAGGLTEGTRLEAVMVSGLPIATLAKPSPTQIIPLPPTRSPRFHYQGIPTDLWLLWRSFLATVLSFPASALTAGRGFIDLFFFFFVLCSEYSRAQRWRFCSILVTLLSIINEACCRERLQI